MGPPNLYGLDRRGLSELLSRYELPAFHAGQVYRWLYARRSFSPDAWTDLPLALRGILAHDATIDPGRVAAEVAAADGTVKYRIDLPAGGSVESVFMLHDGGRVTLCVSSQVGCALGCDFCLTARMGLRRHLAPGEIAGQVALVQQRQELTERSFRVVFMGMGEPLHNYDAVLAAVRLLVDRDGFGLSRRRVTVSTAGLAPAIERLAAEPVRPRLAVSLNATTDEVRDRLMPVNRKYPLSRLLAACRVWARDARERFTFEYVLLAGVNDATEDLTRLERIARGLPAKVNLIPFNAVEGWLDYRPPPRGHVIRFRDELLRRGVPASIRWSRGAEARAACGQLALLPEAPPAAPEQARAQR
jgi:23S rRNA (adenine2503-C2)-methyltransferase